MQDKEIKNLLKNMDIPPHSEEAKARTLQAAMQSFEKNRKGSMETTRLTYTAPWRERLTKGFSMKKIYVYSGSFAAVAIALAITTTHYSDIMMGVGAPPAQPAAMQGAAGSMAQAGAVNPTAPGMAAGVVAPAAPAAPAAPLAVMPNFSSRQAAPLRDMRMGAVAKMKSEPGKRDREMAPRVQSSEIIPGGDQFEKVADNAVKQVSAEPVSTFSIDVDTSSYSFVRRVLNAYRMPEKDMVRVEEMINYFPYDYALPANKTEPFKPTVAVYPSPWNSGNKIVHIGIKGYDVQAAKPHANLVFLIDVSGSMNEQDKLPLVKSSLKMLVEQMDANDTISIVTYAGYSGVALTPTKGSDKQKINAVIDQLGAGGSTAGAAGIEDAYKLAQENFNKNSVNRVILATDGDFNVGVNDPQALQKIIEQKRESGIFLSVLGFGQGNYNDALMQTLAQHGNGNAAYIDNVNEARKVLVNEASSTLLTIAKDVKFQVEFNPAQVASYRLIGYESRMLNREDFNNDKVDAGEVGAGHAVTALYEITPAGNADALRYDSKKPQGADTHFAGEYGFLKIRYKLPDASESKLMSVPINNAVEAKNISEVSDDIRFAAAVAGFGQLLRGEAAVSGYQYNQVLALAESARGKDAFGYRAEFLTMVQKADKFSRPAATPVMYRDRPYPIE